MIWRPIIQINWNWIELSKQNKNNKDKLTMNNNKHQIDIVYLMKRVWMNIYNNYKGFKRWELGSICIFIAGGCCSSAAETLGVATERVPKPEVLFHVQPVRKCWVCFEVSWVLSPTRFRGSTGMCALLSPTTGAMIPAEPRGEDSGEEEEQRGTKRKMSLSGWVV